MNSQSVNVDASPAANIANMIMPDMTPPFCGGEVYFGTTSKAMVVRALSEWNGTVPCHM